MTPRSKFSLIQWHDCLDSTNNEAKRNLHRYDDLSVICAICQTAGRGQGSHRWVSESGENLTFSIVLKPKEGYIPSSEAIILTQLTTLSLCFFLEGEGLAPKIKWPNDIWVDGKKVAGILIENTFSGSSVASSIIGVGLNLNQTEFDALLPNPGSLKLFTAKHYDTVATLDSIYEQFCQLYRKLDSKNSKAELELEFGKRMFVLEKPLQDVLSSSIARFEAAK